MGISLIRKTLLALLALIWGAALLAEPVWIDVRTADEYQQDHIEGDLLIPLSEIEARIEQLVPDKEADIHLYCRSGRRAGVAETRLQALGYRHVSNAGGINDARQTRGLK